MNAREAELIRELQQTKEDLAQANRKIELLQQKIDLLVRRIFGSKGEKLDRGQLLLLLEGLGRAGKSSRARGRGGATALEGSIASA